MSETIYPDIYTCADFGGDLAHLRAAVEARLKVNGEIAPDLAERLDAELAWVERCGMAASWGALARLVELAHEQRIPLGAPLGSADGTLIGAALCSLPNLAAHKPIPLVEVSQLPAPPGVEAPAGKREALLRALSKGDWTAWTPDAGDSGVADAQAILWLRPSSALGILDAALAFAVQHPASGFAPESIALSEWPTLSEGAAALLKKGHVEGVPHLSAGALKGWKGDASAESMAAIVACSITAHGKAKSPDGVVAWTDHTGDTGGALLYHDQFARIVEAAAGMTPSDIDGLRLAMLKGEDGLRARFMEGCAAAGLDEATAPALWNALASAAHGLVSRHAALAWARVVLLLVEVKASHSAAFFAAAFAAQWERGGLAAVKPLAEDARRLSVAVLPPDVGLSLAGPSIEGVGEGLGVRWGLAFLPGWNRAVVERFVEARASANDYRTWQDLTAGAAAAALSPAQLESLVRSGACDKFGGREALLAVIVDSQPPVEKSEAQPGPRLRYARRTWEEQNLGVGFTDASDMDALRRALSAGGDWSGRLTSCGRITAAHAGESVYLVGLLHDVRLLESSEGRLTAAWVEDVEGAVELVAFPPNYKRHAALWTESNAESNLLIITARVCAHQDGNGVYLLCEHLAPYSVEADEQELDLTIKQSRRGASEATVPLPTPEPASANGGYHRPAPVAPDDGRRTTDDRLQTTEITPHSALRTPHSEEPANYELIITLPMSTDDREDIDRMIRLDKLLKAHAGPDTVALRIPYSPETGSYTKAQLPRGVRYSSGLETEIRELLGPDALALIKLLG